MCEKVQGKERAPGPQQPVLVTLILKPVIVKGKRITMFGLEDSKSNSHNLSQWIGGGGGMEHREPHSQGHVRMSEVNYISFSKE